MYDARSLGGGGPWTPTGAHTGLTSDSDLPIDDDNGKQPSFKSLGKISK